jgi:hypothetical protein
MHTAICISVISLLAATGETLDGYNGDWTKMKAITPRGYVCYRATEPIRVDGEADEKAWAAAPWTDDFVDIQGSRKPKPRFRTRAKMLWDDAFFYVHAEMEEPHVWGALTKKNSVIFYDNDFEVFIDPDGDNHNYYEFEMNALNTIWELSLDKPYMDGGPVRNKVNIPGLKSAVHVRGTLNNPRDTDRGWTLEIAFPWKGLAKYAGGKKSPPTDGAQWRVGFSRVEWLIDIIDFKYRKVPRKAHGEDNWVWSPQGIINMHRPERWGYVQFSTAKPGSVKFRPDATLAARDALMGVYHRQRAYRKKFGRYAKSLEALGIDQAVPAGLVGPPRILLTKDGFTATAKAKLPNGSTRTLSVRQDSRLSVDHP